LRLFDGKDGSITLSEWKATMKNAFRKTGIEDTELQCTYAAIHLDSGVIESWESYKDSNADMASPTFDKLLLWLAANYDVVNISFDVMQQLSILRFQVSEDLNAFNKSFDNLAAKVNIKEAE
ncbi:hypothetical protein EV179_006545, partial [Coemansia sp. RSA 487]